MSKVLLRALSGSLALLLFIELVLQCLPVSTATSTGYYQDPVILGYPAHHIFVSSTGWDLRNAQVNRANNAGFVAARDFQAGQNAVALIGDSYVESSMLPMDQRPAAQLERALAGRPVYAMGAPGSALLDYAERMRWASERYGVRDFVLVLENGDLWESLCGSGQGHGPCLDPGTLAPRIKKSPPAGLFKRVLRHSALAQYVLGQLKFSPERLWQQVQVQARAPVAIEPEVRKAQSDRVSPGALAVAEAFFAKIAELHPRRLVFVLDARRSAIYAAQSPTESADLAAFSVLAKKAGAEVVEAAPILSSDYAKRGLSFDVGPYDGHINSLGWQLLMHDAAGRICADSTEPCPAMKP